MGLIAETEKQRLVLAIDKAEEKTSGDIVAVVLAESDSYRYIPLLWSAGLALITPALIGLLGLDWRLAAVYAAQVGVFIASGLIFRLPQVKALLIPASVKHRRANRNARTVFFDHGLHATPENNAVMIFVSELEHHVEIIADHGVNRHAPEGYWQELVNELTAHIKKGKAADGLILAVERCGDLLAAHYPADGPRRNDLPNDVVDQ